MQETQQAGGALSARLLRLLIHAAERIGIDDALTRIS
jgi:hypothetical protein